MSIWEKIANILLAPYNGVYTWLDAYIDNTVVKWIVYLLWCLTFGFMIGVTTVVVYLFIYALIHKDELEE